MRRVNAISAMICIIVFSGHALLSSAGIQGYLSGIFHAAMWIGLLAAAGHIALSAITTYSMFTDKVYPASRKKKQHQYLKWATGIVLLAFIAMHCLGIFPPIANHATAALLMLALAAHVYVGTKSFLKDLNISRAYRTLVRVLTLLIAGITLALICWR